MTTAHKIQVALLLVGHVWAGWTVWRELREIWLGAKKNRQERTGCTWTR